MNPSIFKAYDIRGIYPTEIDESGATKIGQACAKMFEQGTVVIAHDVRHGSESMAKKMVESIQNTAGDKIKIVFVGLSTTPMFYFLVNDSQARGGCMVTASHNPKNYNGFKIVTEKGHVISGLEIQKIISTL